MGAAIGNQNAKGHGRPPKLYSDYECGEIGEELLRWMKENETNDKIVHLSQFYREIKDMSYDDWENLCSRISFSGYYLRAREWMGVKTLLNSKLPVPYGSRFVHMYLRDLRAHEKEIKEETSEIEAAAKAKVISSLSEEELEQNRRVIEAVQAFQAKKE